jgi:hypothetical protein
VQQDLAQVAVGLDSGGVWFECHPDGTW